MNIVDCEGNGQGGSRLVDNSNIYQDVEDIKTSENFVLICANTARYRTNGGKYLLFAADEADYINWQATGNG